MVKMTAPSLPPWVEEGHESAGGFEQGADVAAFGDIAAEAGEGEVFLRGLPAVLATDDVFNPLPHLNRAELITRI